jgi:hypothetical protein
MIGSEKPSATMAVCTKPGTVFTMFLNCNYAATNVILHLLGMRNPIYDYVILMNLDYL